MKAGTRALLEKATESLKAACLLRSQGYPGIAASRAYYAMFYAAQALLLERGLAFSSHSAVIAAFGKHLAKTCVVNPRLHRYLIEAQDLRNVADYGVEAVLDDTQADEALVWAGEFLEAAAQVLI
jgi:uncharacterized protein (UPF0332 family)